MKMFKKNCPRQWAQYIQMTGHRLFKELRSTVSIERRAKNAEATQAKLRDMARPASHQVHETAPGAPAAKLSAGPGDFLTPEEKEQLLKEDAEAARYFREKLRKDGDKP